MFITKGTKSWKQLTREEKGDIVKGLARTTRSFNNWAEIFLYLRNCGKRLREETELRHLALEKMAETASNFREWQTLFSNTSNPKLRKLASQKMIETAVGPEGLEIACGKIPKSCESGDVLLKNMAATANTFKDWESVCREALILKNQTGREIEAICYKGMAETAQSFEDWISLYYYSPNGSEVEDIALKKLCDPVYDTNLSAFFNDYLQTEHGIEYFWKYFKAFHFSPDGCKLKKFAQEKMEHAKGNFWDWYEVWLSADNEELKSYVLEKMANSAAHFWEWRRVHLSAPDNSEIKNLALKKMAGDAKSFEEKKRTCHCTPEGSELREMVVREMKNPNKV